MRKILWLGLAVLALVLLSVVSLTSGPVAASSDAASVTWMSWFLLAGSSAVTVWAFRTLARHDAQTSPFLPTIPAADTGSASAPPPTPAPLRILASAVATVAGRDAAAVLQALCEAPPLPSPDPELLDERGLPRLSARCKDLDLAALTASLPATDPPSPPLRAAVLRALALQSATLEDLQAALLQEPADGELDVLWMVPTHWTEQERALASAWLTRSLSAQRPGAASAPCIHLLDASEAATTLQRLRVHADPLRSGSAAAGRVIALACDSRLDGAPSPRASRAHPPLPPGEAAAALMLWRAPSESPWPPPDLEGQSAVTRWAISGAASGTASAAPRSLRELAAQALDDPTACDQIAWAVSDVGLTGTPAREVLDCLVDRLPRLDVSERLCRLGLACGDLGAATPLVALALASQAASQAPTVLLLSGREPAVALLSPSAPASASASTELPASPCKAF